jgi:hypothetical protein
MKNLELEKELEKGDWSGNPVGITVPPGREL